MITKSTTFSALLCAGAVLLSMPAQSSTTSYTCNEIHRNYIDAVNQYKEVLETMKGNDEFKKAHNSFQDAINSGLTQFSKGNYTYPSLKTNYSAIKNSKVPNYASGSNGGVDQLDNQRKSADTRVGQWKEKNSTTTTQTPCRELWGCDLGQPNTRCSASGAV